MKNYLKEIDKVLESEPDPAFSRRAKIIFENLNLAGNEKILEIGCGRGFYLKTLLKVLPFLEITGIDINDKYLSEAKEFINNSKVKLIKTDATKLPFQSNTFDRIIATEILEHVPDDKKVLSEIYRVLKPGGIVMVTVPNKNYPFFWDPLNWILERIFHWHLPSNIWWLSGIWAGHVRLYGFSDLQKKLQSVGFKVKKTWQSTYYCFPFSHFLLYGIGKNLVERGLLKDYDRFSQRNDKKWRKILVRPLFIFDYFNKNKVFNSSVNLIFKITK